MQVSTIPSTRRFELSIGLIISNTLRLTIRELQIEVGPLDNTPAPFDADTIRRDSMKDCTKTRVVGVSPLTKGN
jgi:hypothetical protein